MLGKLSIDLAMSARLFLHKKWLRKKKKMLDLEGKLAINIEHLNTIHNLA
jgi:hypothetical protein